MNTVSVYVPGSTPPMENQPSEDRAEPQYCAAELASPTVYVYAVFRPVMPTPATLPRPLAGT